MVGQGRIYLSIDFNRLFQPLPSLQEGGSCLETRHDGKGDSVNHQGVGQP